MLSKCANPQCSTPFLYLHKGQLFRFEVPALQANAKPAGDQPSKPARRLEYFWLCEECVRSMTLVQDQKAGVTIAPAPMRSKQATA
jgi:hypothetical protein